jgi:uncharacterized protein
MDSDHLEARQGHVAPVRSFRWRPWLLGAAALALVVAVAELATAYRDVADLGEIARGVDWLVVLVLGLVAATSFLSGIFGMVGGMILIGALVLLLDLTTAMLLITSVLLATNVWRLASWSKHAAWKVIAVVTLGGLIAFAALRHTGFVPTKGWVLVILGAPPLLINLIPASLWPSIDRVVGQAGCGLVAGMAQVMGGSGAAITEIFFQKSRLSRVEMVATKAGLNVPMQLLRGAYFALATYTATGTLESSVPISVFGAAIVVGIAATSAGGYVLKHWLSDSGFLAWNWRFSSVSSAFFVSHGVWLLVI